MINILKNTINQLIEKNEELERQNAELKKFLEDDCNTSKPIGLDEGIELENINQFIDSIKSAIGSGRKNQKDILNSVVHGEGLPRRKIKHVLQDFDGETGYWHSMSGKRKERLYFLYEPE